MAENYKPAGWFTRNVFNRIVALCGRLGIGFHGSRVLEVRGRKSGEWRETPVNLLTVDGQDYLVAPRGHTQWVRNIRASGGGGVGPAAAAEAGAGERAPPRDQ